MTKASSFLLNSSLSLFAIIAMSNPSMGQEKTIIPKVYSNIFLDEQGKLFFKHPETGQVWQVYDKTFSIPDDYSKHVTYEKPVKMSIPDSIKPGMRKNFWFAFASDSRETAQKGDTNKNGVNVFGLSSVTHLAGRFHATFFQFTGDMGSGYNTDKDASALQLATWKEFIYPFGTYFPIFTGIGNHETVMTEFHGKTNEVVRVDRFPFPEESTESVFKMFFANPDNGPESEDGSKYDPDTAAIDFPTYKGNVYYYTCDNVAMIVLNSEYWYSASGSMIRFTGGNPHGYIMDNQLDWLKHTISKLESDRNIDHIFVTLHTPLFPNGGHSGDCMWYKGNNEIRPYIAGKAVDKGIIERRDEILDLLVNKSKKTLAILCGDEHNYSRLFITDSMPRYPEGWKLPKLTLSRPIWQITNGCAGAPQYNQETLPWSDFVKKFSKGINICMFYVRGKEVRVETLEAVKNELVEEVYLRKD